MREFSSQIASSSKCALELLLSIIALFCARRFHASWAFSFNSESIMRSSIFQPVTSPLVFRGTSFKSRSEYSNMINSWSDGVGRSSSIAYLSRGPISIVVKVRSMIEPVWVMPGLVIAPGSLFRISI